LKCNWTDLEPGGEKQRIAKTNYGKYTNDCS